MTVPCVDRIHIDVVAGTRPEITKLAPVLHALAMHKHGGSVALILSGQQRALVEQALVDMRVERTVASLVRPNYDLSPQGEWRSRFVSGLTERWSSVRPWALVVQGDTDTGRIGAETASALHIPIVHLEAGIRHAVLRDGAVEERNRRAISSIATFHVAVSDEQRVNLLNEGLDERGIMVAGDLSAAALHHLYANDDPGARASGGARSEHVGELDQELGNTVAANGYVLVTLHRVRSLRCADQIACRLMTLADSVAPRPLVLCQRPDTRWDAFTANITTKDNIVAIPSPNPRDFRMWSRYAAALITDSAGVQQEGLLTGKRVIAIRDEVELYADHSHLILWPPECAGVAAQVIEWCLGQPTWCAPRAEWASIGAEYAQAIIEFLSRDELSIGSGG